MQELIDMALKTLLENPHINEVEVTNTNGGKIRLVRNTPIPTYYSPGWYTRPTEWYVHPTEW